MEISILGETYTVKECRRSEDKYLSSIGCDGYCDCTSRIICVRSLHEEDGDSVDDFVAHRNRVMRHEIIHAFMFESGLGQEWEHKDGHDETTVDWIARQFPKLSAAFKQADCL